jgi:Transcriptional regulator, AbiEi antitoxin, Type IV TA system
MKYEAITEKARETLLECFQEVPFLDIETQAASGSKNSKADFTLQAKTPTGKRTLLVEVKAIGQPRIVRDAVNQLLRYKNELPDAYGIIMAPYISAQSAEICLKDGFGYADLAGNCRISFDQVFISKEGKKNQFSRKRDLRSLYSPKAERVLHQLFSTPMGSWKMQLLAKAAKVSLGQVANVKQLLLEREWIEIGKDGFQLTAPDKLLAEWSANYDFGRNTAREYYSLHSVANLERLLADDCEQNNVLYALAGFSSAARFASMVRYQRAMAYISGNIDEIARRLELKSVASGANISLVAPYDDGVFSGAETKDAVKVTSPLQTYLDLCQIKGRGEEAAEFLKEKVIQPTWPTSAQITRPKQ